MSVDARALFSDVYKGHKNFMTPVVIRYGNRGPYYYELSKGKGLRQNTIYGVTVIYHTPFITKRRHDLSKCCHSLDEAEYYISQL